MPIGIVSDLLSILIGSIIGINFKHLMPERIKVSLIKIFGICALTIGIVSLMKINSLPAVFLFILKLPLLFKYSKTHIKTNFL